MVLLARTTPKDQIKKRTEGLSVFLIDMQEAKKNGMTIKPIRTMLNHSTNEVFFDNVPIPASSLIGEEGQGLKYILSGMNAERILIAAECIGDARWFIKKATDYACERKVFGRPIGQNQGIHHGSSVNNRSIRAEKRQCARAGIWVTKFVTVNNLVLK
jgi:alkylation response protein AidB-like acyl-CoA dehydrogenase